MRNKGSGSPKSNVYALHSSSQSRTPHWKEPRRLSDVGIGLVLISIVAAAAYLAYEDPGDALPLPKSGALTLSRPLKQGEASAPFSVVPDDSNLEANYFIKVSDWESKVPVATVFVRGGQPATVQLPLGTYRITIAQGETWYGPEQLFGNLTQIKEGVQPSIFYQSGARQTVGATLNLTPRFAGNYPMEPARRSSFSDTAR
jgi:hypothetical protein